MRNQITRGYEWQEKRLGHDEEKGGSKEEIVDFVRFRLAAADVRTILDAWDVPRSLWAVLLHLFDRLMGASMKTDWTPDDVAMLEAASHGS